jgi:hypothetical protein
LLREDFFCTIKTVESDQSFELVQQIPRSAGNYLPVHLQLLKFLLAVRGKNASFELFSVGLLSVETVSSASVSYYSPIKSLKSLGSD